MTRKCPYCGHRTAAKPVESRGPYSGLVVTVKCGICGRLFYLSTTPKTSKTESEEPPEGDEWSGGFAENH